jgi:glycosyltransferase involved in cell wall biosynthesis
VNPIGPLRQAITVTGNIDENKLQTGLAACDICWLPMVDIPANQGRFPLKFTNYLAAARPMIVTDVGDIPKIVIKFGVGLTCNPTAKSLAEATLRMASNPNTVRAFGTAAEELSHNPQHSWRNRAKKLLEVYQKVK